MHVGCTKTATLTNEQRKEHLKTEHVYHTTLLLQHGIKLGKELETLLTRDPRLLSRHPHVFKNYDGVIADIMGQLQQNSTEFNILRSTVQEQSQRITSLERKITNLDSSSISSTSQNNSIQGVTPNVRTVQRITNAENKLADHELLLVESNRTLETCFRDVGNARRLVESNQEIVRRVERRIESIEHTLALRNVTLADLGRLCQTARILHSRWPDDMEDQRIRAQEKRSGEWTTGILLQSSLSDKQIRIQDVRADIPKRRRDGKGYAHLCIFRGDAQPVRRHPSLAVQTEGHLHAHGSRQRGTRYRRLQTRPQ